MNQRIETALEVAPARAGSSARDRSGSARPGRAVVGVLVGTACIDLIWCLSTGFEVTGLVPAAAVLALLCAIGIYYTVIRSAPPLAEFALYLAAWLAFIATGGIFSYLAATSPRPFSDDLFVAADSVLRFDWARWVATVQQYPALTGVLEFSYNSLLMQILGSVCLFSFTKAQNRNAELLLASSIAALLCSVVFAFFPAVGPWIHFDAPDNNPLKMLYVNHLIALKEGALRVVALKEIEGIICFPSYHTSLACVFVYAHRGLYWTRWPVLVLNALMLLSIPSQGGHYLSDVVAGIGAALLAIGAARALSGGEAAARAGPRRWSPERPRQRDAVP